MARDRKEKKAKVRSEGASALKAAVREDEGARKKARKVARRKPAVVVVPPPWNAAERKAEYLEALKAETNIARFKLSGQLLAVMHGQTEEKDGDPIPAPVQNLGVQLKGLVEQVATKAAIETFNRAKEIYERERQRKIEAKAAQEDVKASRTVGAAVA